MSEPAREETSSESVLDSEELLSLKGWTMGPEVEGR